MSLFATIGRNYLYKRGRQFTLVELLIIIAIMGILASILLPALNRATQQARSVICLNNFHQCGIAIHAYASDANGYSVIGDGWDTFSGPATRARHWPNILMESGYMPDIRTNIYYSASGYCGYSNYSYASDVYSCPAISPPPNGVCSINKGMTSSYAAYSIRYFKDSFYAYRGERFSNGFNLPRLATIWAKAPFMADALKILDPTGSPFSPPRQYNSGLRWAGDTGSATWGTQSYISHETKSNTLFSDGSARGLAEVDYMLIPQPFGYGATPSSSYWFVRVP